MTYHNLNPLNPKITIWILNFCPYLFPTEVVGRSWKNIKQIRRMIMSVILMTTLFYKKHWYYKEKFDADHSWGLKG